GNDKRAHATGRGAGVPNEPGMPGRPAEPIRLELRAAGTGYRFARMPGAEPAKPPEGTAEAHPTQSPHDAPGAEPAKPPGTAVHAPLPADFLPARLVNGVMTSTLHGPHFLPHPAHHTL